MNISGGKKEAISEIKASIAQYEKYTCIRFKQWYGEQSYFSFYDRGGGWVLVVFLNFFQMKNYLIESDIRINEVIFGFLKSGMLYKVEPDPEPDF